MSFKMSYQNMEFLMMYIGKIYRECLETHENLIENKIFKERVDDILERMNNEYVCIIKNDFLSPKEEGWYHKIFTKKEYFAYKKGAMKTFLHCLYD